MASLATFFIRSAVLRGAWPELVTLLRRDVTEIRDAKRFDEDAGICRRVYSEGVLGGYPWQSEGFFE